MKYYITFASLLLVTLAFGQSTITIDDFTTVNTFSQKSVYGINWMKDGKYYTSLDDNKVKKYDITTGSSTEILVDGSSLSPAVSIEEYGLSGDEKKLLLLTNREKIYRRSFRADYYVFDLTTKSLVPLSPNGKQQYAAFSPDGSHVAFARDNNLFVVRLADMLETAVTSDGMKNSIINGSTDWVYEEEFSFPDAFYWSPDGTKIAYYRFDESRVKEYNMQIWDEEGSYPQDYRFKYPKAGEENAQVEIFVYNVATKAKTKIDLGSDEDFYIPRVKWTADPDLLSIRKMNRLQNKLDLLHAKASTGKTTTVYSEKSNTFIDLDYIDNLHYLADQKHMIIASERNGWKNFYLYDISGQLINPITVGNGWESTSFVGVDEKRKTLYYISTEDGHLNRSFWSTSLDGKRKKRLSTTIGYHGINMSPDFQYYIDYATSSTQPLTVTLFQTKKNKAIKTLENNAELSANCKEYQVTNKEFFTYLSADGKTSLDGYFVKPKDFDASKKYPVLVYQYSGPRNPSVMNTFGIGQRYIWFQMLAQQGILVAVADTRGTGFRGESFTKQTYKHLGEKELEDLLALGKFLGKISYIDNQRLAIYGWSYGGYMAALAMTKGSGVYQVGIAGAPVTDYRFYDTIYTERYMQTPQLNPEGYNDNPIRYAANLKDDFLLIHGTGDDNVHFQNSVMLENALINAGKQFRSFYYPNQAHGFRGRAVVRHLYVQMTNFLKEKL